jgi:hypothetical protein
MKDIHEYRAVDLKSPTIIFWLIIIFCISIFMFWLFTISNNLWLSIFTILASLLFPFVVYYSITAKIILTSNSIVKKTFIGRTELKYDEIKSFGAYNQIGKVALVITESEQNKSEFFAQKFGYVSIDPNYNPNSFKQKGSIRFHLIDNIYENLKERLPAANTC